MKKKLLTFVLAGALVLSAVACQKQQTADSKEITQIETTQLEEKNNKTTKEITDDSDVESKENVTDENGNEAIDAETIRSADYSALDSVTFIIADSTSKGSAGQFFGEMITEKIAEITDGKFTIDHYPNGEYGQDKDLLEMAQNGEEIQMVICQPAPMVEFVPEMAVFDMPMLFSEYDGKTIHHVLNDPSSLTHQRLEDGYAKANLHLLGILQNATYRLTTANKELRTIHDFKDLHIRTMDNENHLAFWKALGADPVPMEWGEVPLALKSGMIEAQENAADTIIGAYLNEVQTYLASTNHILYANQICINQAIYESLDPLYQAALDLAVQESIEELAIQLKEIDEENKAILEENGMTLIEYDTSFYDTVFDMVEVQKLLTDIDIETGGLGSILKDELKHQE